MKKLLIGLIAIGLATQFSFSQIVELPEVTLDFNDKYLTAVTSDDVPLDVMNLEKEVAYFNIVKSDLYNEENHSYKVSFYIPEGSIMAFYNTEGKIKRTIERFKKVKLPRTILTAVLGGYPNWEIADNAYRVDYYDRSGIAKKQYRVKLKNANNTLTVKFDENGEYL